MHRQSAAWRLAKAAQFRAEADVHPNAAVRSKKRNAAARLEARAAEQLAQAEAKEAAWVMFQAGLARGRAEAEQASA
jgi:hypothetical protein